MMVGSMKKKKSFWAEYQEQKMKDKSMSYWEEYKNKNHQKPEPQQVIIPKKSAWEEFKEKNKKKHSAWEEYESED